MLTIPDLWLGSEESLVRQARGAMAYLDHLESYTKAEQVWRQARPQLSNGEDAQSLENELARELVEVRDTVGIVTVSGSLVSQTSWFDHWMGRVSYPTLAAAVNALVEDPKVETIIMAWNSDGGDASGIYDFGAFLEEADAIKPVYSWVGQKALSAAYWAAASTRKVYASEMGQLGSIGVIATFTSIARQLKDMGVDVTVVRSSPMKAPLHPAEPISEQGKSVLEEQVSALHDFFVEHIQETRPALAKSDQSIWASGKTFFASDAIDIGLADGPTIQLGKLISKLNSGNTRRSTTGVHPMARQTLLSAAASAEDFTAEQARAQAELGVGHPSLQSGAETAPPAEEPPPVEPPVESPAGPQEVAMTGDQVAVVALLKEQLAESQQAVLALQMKLQTAETQLAAQSGDSAQLRPMAEWALSRLQTALGQSPIDLTGLPASNLAAQYAALLTKFEAAFATGRHTAGSARPLTPDTLQQALAEARVAAGHR